MPPTPPPAGPVLSRAAVRELDRLAVERFGLPTIVLMENAARGAAAIALDMLRDRRETRAGQLMPHAGSSASHAAPSALILCGPGNNGGDGLAMARHLSNAGVSVSILLAAEPATPDARVHAEIVRRMDLPMERAAARPDALPDAADAARDAFRRAVRRLPSPPDLLVDALLGTGLTRPIGPPIATLIELANGLADRLAAPSAAAGRPRVLAVDLPSGLDADTGRPLPIAVRADRTATLAALKPGLLSPEGAAHCGRIDVIDIGAPRTLIEGLASSGQFGADSR